MSEKGSKPDAEKESAAIIRPVGLTFSSFFYGAAGVYYLVYPFLVKDPTIVPLYIIGALSLIGSYGLMKMAKWGLWLGLLLFPAQITAPTFALQAVLPSLNQNYEAVVFAASLIVLIFFASITFLLVLDKRKSLTQPS